MSQSKTNAGRQDRTSIAIDSDVLERLKRLKPFQSMSHEEFVSFLLDQYDEQRKERLSQGHDLIDTEDTDTTHKGGKK